MATQEIYIRNASETEARGPYNHEQLVSLAETGGVTPETLVYDATTEQWVTLGANPGLMAVAFPEKKKLVLKAKDIKTLNKSEENARAITVDDMLAAAEGRTSETADKQNPEIAMARAARIGMWSAIVTLVVAAAGEILPGTDALMSMDSAKIIAQPLVILGAVDIVLAVLLGLGMVSLYPFVRFRAMLGLGLVGFMCYAQGLHVPLVEVAIGSAGLYLSTVFVSLMPVLLGAAAGIIGMGALTWSFIS